MRHVGENEVRDAAGTVGSRLVMSCEERLQHQVAGTKGDGELPIQELKATLGKSTQVDPMFLSEVGFQRVRAGHRVGVCSASAGQRNEAGNAAAL